MNRNKNSYRQEKNIIVNGRIHTIIEQNHQTQQIYPGAYLGMEGWVLKSIEPKILISHS